MSGDMLNLTIAFGGLFLCVAMMLVAVWIDETVKEEEKKEKLAASNEK